jgi:HEAT repeat protein
MDTFIREVVLITVKSSSSVELTNSESEFLNSFPASKVIPVLQELFENETDPTIKSRAFDAILVIQEFDKVQFLVDVLNKLSSGWRAACCGELSRFQDKRAIAALCDVLLHDSDPDVRYTAAESLAINGDRTAVEVLEYAKKHDTGEDYEGFRVADMASEALEQIRSRISQQ